MENTTTFTITYTDIEELQKTIKRLQPKEVGGYAPYEFLLTEDDQPLSLLCKAFNKWTENELFDNTIDYYSEAESYSLDGLDWENSFLNSLNKKEKKELSENIEKYNTLLDEFTQKAKEYFSLCNELEDADLMEEHQKNMDEHNSNLLHEYLYGDYREKGVLEHINNDLGDDTEMEYNKEDGSITITLENHENNWENKQSFLESMKYRAISNLKEEEEKYRKRNEEFSAKQEIKEKFKENQNKRRIEKLLS